MKKFLSVCCIVICLIAESFAGKYKCVVLETNLGNIKLKLYEDTPLHSENFLRLVKSKHYDGLLFHRVIQDFMIQGGASDSRGAEKGKMLGMTDPGYTLEAEIRPEHRHEKGALCAARQSDQVNPEKRSSAEQFYIVQGKVYTDEELNKIEDYRLNKAKNKLFALLFEPKKAEYDDYMRKGQRAKADKLAHSVMQEVEKQFSDYREHYFTPQARENYKTIGGTPFLDGEYTVFGEVVEGLDVLDKIAAQQTDKNDRPLEDVVILKTKLIRSCD